MLPVCPKMLVLLVLTLGATIQHLDAQFVHLNVKLPWAEHYVTYYAMGESTLAVGRLFLPRCTPYDDGDFFGMKSMTRSVAYRAPIQYPSGGNLYWNFTANPAMIPQLSGTYRCYTRNRNSSETYTLHVVVPLNLTCKQNWSFDYTSTKLITCLVSGYPLPTVTWGRRYGNVTDTPPSLDDGVFTFNSTLTISVSANNMAAGVQVAAVNVTAKLPAYSCTPGWDASVQTTCQNMPRSATRLFAVTISYVTTTHSSTSSSPTLDPLTMRQATNTASPVDRPTSETPSMTQSSTDVQGSETASPGMPLWIPIAIAVTVFVVAVAILIPCAKRRRDRLRKTSYSCRRVAPAQGGTQSGAYEDAERIDIRATGNAAYKPCPVASRQPGLCVPGSTGTVVYEDGEIMESTTRNAAYTLTRVPNQPNYEFIS